jgi:hypothetical protein
MLEMSTVILGLTAQYIFYSIFFALFLLELWL